LSRPRHPLSSRPRTEAEFGESWWAWWRALQPKWRNIGSGTIWPQQFGRRLATGDGAWTPLRHPGPNGVFLVILGLFWWGHALAKNRDASMPWGKGKGEVGWTTGVSDVTWMVEGLIEANAKAEAGGPQGDTE
ncbi:hypothetical protein B0H15DRAFT_794756, partial [Mycena belliarum]